MDFSQSIKKNKIFNKLSGYSFLLSTISSKIQYIPITIITPFFNLAALVLNLVGHSMWFIACYFYSDHPPQYTKWYGFAPFKEQNSYAAFLGIGGALISFAALAIPSLAIAAAWIFVLSNIFWAVGEYHKLKNPPKEDDYSESYQKSYLSYALITTAIGLVAAVAATLTPFYPLLTIPIIALSTFTSIGLTIAAVEYWFDYTFGDHKKMGVIETSSQKISNSLGVSNALLHEVPSPKPYQGPALLSPIRDVNDVEYDSDVSTTCAMR